VRAPATGPRRIQVMSISKTRSSFYRRLYVAYLIDTGVDTVPAIEAFTGMPRRTAQDTLQALAEIDITCRFVGAKRNGAHVIDDWGPIRLDWLRTHIEKIAQALGYPSP